MQNHFESIYGIALEKDETALKNLLSQGVSIDEFQQGSFYLTPAAACARDGSREAAEWLRQHRAGVDWIAQGAAIGGHIDYAETLRIQHRVNVDWIAEGAAIGGHIDYAETLRIQHRVNVNWIAEGAAIGGHIDYAETLRIQHRANVDCIARGAAIGGHIDYAETLRIQHRANVDWIARGAAIGGHIDYAETLRIQHRANVDWIARGAAIGGHIDYAETLRIQHRANVDWIARGAAIGGHIDYAETLRIQHRANVDWIARGAAIGGHIDYAETLRIQHRANVDWIAEGAANGGHLKSEKSIYYFLVAIQDVACRNAFAAAFKHQINSQSLRQKMPTILNKANRIAHCMKKHQLDPAQAEFLYLYQKNHFQRYATWFLQVRKSLQTQYTHLANEVFLLISQYATGLDAQQTQQLDTLFERFRFQINQPALMIKALNPFTTRMAFFTTSADIRKQALRFTNEIKAIENSQALEAWLNKTLTSLQEGDSNVSTSTTQTSLLTHKKPHPLYQILARFAQPSQQQSSSPAVASVPKDEGSSCQIQCVIM